MLLLCEALELEILGTIGQTRDGFQGLGQFRVIRFEIASAFSVLAYYRGPQEVMTISI